MPLHERLRACEAASADARARRAIISLHHARLSRAVACTAVALRHKAASDTTRKLSRKLVAKVQAGYA
jgi:hypothetical protein